jgi:hypothetical protein
MMVTQNHEGKETDLLLLRVSVLQRGSLTVTSWNSFWLGQDCFSCPPSNRSTVFLVTLLVYIMAGVQLSLCMVKRHSGEQPNSSLILDLCSREKFEWSTSCHGHFTPGTHWTACWVGTRVGLESSEEDIILLPLLRNECLVIQLADYMLSWLCHLALGHIFIPVNDSVSVSVKFCYQFQRLHDVTAQNTAICMLTNVKIWEFLM